MSEKLKTSKEVIRCCYKISDTDVDCLFKLVELGKPVTSEELSALLKMSKTTVENSLKKLIDIGLVVREKGDEKKIGRPKYYYEIISNYMEKLKHDLTECSRKIQSSMSNF
ncbi:helix-turn-helix domain-containing protein [Stygiolobus azoricus]|uniref:ArsR family transcriptional regulator n=1 Tax=Stygiolobus azoricus TaxID=41675 RepID=A0A650CL00_9CREN|nr:helix-turn-helix domain-containing protein [Stygiolobus azoricus]QGR18551.1 ArsR family transcriptional regulator [Stygiolobus azoricus]